VWAGGNAIARTISAIQSVGAVPEHSADVLDIRAGCVTIRQANLVEQGAMVLQPQDLIPLPLEHSH